MAIVLDGSSPGYFQINTDASGNDSGTSASFTPPDNSLIVVHQTSNAASRHTPTFAAPTNTGTALTWTKLVSDSPGGTSTAMAVAIFAAYNTHQAGAITVSVSASGVGGSATTNNSQGSVQVWTGAASSQTGATKTGTSTTANISPSLTTTANGSQVIGNFGDWSGSNTPTSTDSGTGWKSGTNSDGIVAYKASNTPTSGTLVAVNAQVPSGALWTYALVEILAGAAPTIVEEDAEWIQFIQPA